MSYLCNRSLQVRTRDKILHPLFIQNVTQGSILGPILFLNYSKDIFLLTKDISATMIVHGNDSTCLITADSIDTAHSNMKQFIIQLINSFKQISSKKFLKNKIFYFVQQPYHPSLWRYQNRSKLLGVYLDDDLSYQPQMGNNSPHYIFPYTYLILYRHMSRL